MTELKRKDMWVEDYNKFIDEIRSEGFDWTKNDCGPRFVGKLCMVLLGENKSASLAEQYHDEESALATMKSLGVDNLADAVKLYLPEYENPQLAQMGDIAAIALPSSPFGYALGIVNGERVFVLHQRGVGVVNRRNIARAFKVG